MRRFFSAINKRIKTITALYKAKAIHIAGLTCFGSFILGSGKLIMGIYSLSFFACANAFYTYGIVLAKAYAILGIAYTEDTNKQCKYYKRSGIILIIASLSYLIYSIKLISNPSNVNYTMNQGLMIALITFVEIGLNIRGMIIERNNDNIMYHALRAISFASSLISLVLTQTAILSFTAKSEGYINNFSSNGFLGILMALLATLIGGFIIYRGTMIEKGRNLRVLFKKVNKFLINEKVSVQLYPRNLKRFDNKMVLGLDESKIENFEEVRVKVWNEFQIDLCNRTEKVKKRRSYLGHFSRRRG